MKMLPRVDVCCVLSRLTFVLWIYHQVRLSADRSRYAKNWVVAFRVGIYSIFAIVEDALVCVCVRVCVCVCLPLQSFEVKTLPYVSAVRALL